MLFAVARKLGREVLETEARAFEQLSHEGKKRTLAPLLAEEQLLAAQGDVPPPPKAAPSPRHEVVQHVGKLRDRPQCTDGHIWSLVAEDGWQNCATCGAEMRAAGANGFVERHGRLVQVELEEQKERTSLDELAG